MSLSNTWSVGEMKTTEQYSEKDLPLFLMEDWQLDKLLRTADDVDVWESAQRVYRDRTGRNWRRYG